jgi:hypothetical protein
MEGILMELQIDCGKKKRVTAISHGSNENYAVVGVPAQKWDLGTGRNKAETIHSEKLRTAVDFGLRDSFTIPS